MTSIHHNKPQLCSALWAINVPEEFCFNVCRGANMHLVNLVLQIILVQVSILAYYSQWVLMSLTLYFG